MTEKEPVAGGGGSGVRENENAPEFSNTTPTDDTGIDWANNRRGKDSRETLLLLQDRADLLVDAVTPLEALIAFYDLLEVTRFLYKHRNIFHRDISAGNVLLRDKGWEPLSPFKDKFGDMCFASHLLGEKGPKPTASRLYTRVLLIDFDMAEDRGAQSVQQQATDRGGTPMFMARLVRNPVVEDRDYCHQAMPELQGFALQRYEACVGNRISEFPKNRKSKYDIEAESEIPYSHRLSYDAESTLWLLYSWAIQVKPAKGNSNNQIDEYLWTCLTGGEGAVDPRVLFVRNFPKRACHPFYHGLDELLCSLCKQLSGYQEQVARPLHEHDPGRMKDEYLHEAFQRTILDFIVKTIDEPFMREPINRIRRLRQLKGAMSQSTKTPSIGMKRSHHTMAGADPKLSEQPDPKRPDPPTENPNFN